MIFAKFCSRITQKVSRAEKKRREEKRREENRTEQNRTEQRTEQNRTEQNRTEQNRTEQNSIYLPEKKQFHSVFQKLDQYIWHVITQFWE